MWLLPAALLALTLPLYACILTLDEVVTPADAGDILDLAGTWIGTWPGDSIASIAVIAPSSAGYRMRYMGTDSRVATFDATFGTIGGRFALELTPAALWDDAPGQIDLALAGRLQLFLDPVGDEVRVSALDPDVVEPALHGGALPLTFVRDAEYRTILLGDRDTLHAVLATAVADGRLLTEAGVWRRASPSAMAPLAAPFATVPCYEAANWRDADVLFHRDPRWVGGDGASSVDLGDGRTLWLFGDSWIDPTGTGRRLGARMVSNSIGLQTGRDPSSASMRMYWGTDADGRATAFVPDEPPVRHWFGNGVRVEDRVVLFLSRVVSVPTGLGFEGVGWAAVLIENPDDDPAAWRVRRLATAENPLGVAVGSAAVTKIGDYVYAFGSANPVKTHPIYAVRWHTDHVRNGDLHEPEWWAGALDGWVPDASSAARWPLFGGAQSDLTIHWDDAAARFLAVHTVGFGPADVAMRAATTLTGPWTSPQMIFRPPEYHLPAIMIYSAKAHPSLAGGDLVLTYATNSSASNAMLTDSLVYYPRFVRLTRCW